MLLSNFALRLSKCGAEASLACGRERSASPIRSDEWCSAVFAATRRPSRPTWRTTCVNTLGRGRSSVTCANIRPPKIPTWKNTFALSTSDVHRDSSNVQVTLDQLALSHDFQSLFFLPEFIHEHPFVTCMIFPVQSWIISFLKPETKFKSISDFGHKTISFFFSVSEGRCIMSP